jgi:cytolysin-activating lysine-acyltransferase
MLSAEAEARVLGGTHLIGPEEWGTGGRVVVTDFVAPFGDARAMVADLRRNVLRGRDIAATRRAPDGGLRRVARYPAVDAAGRRIAPLRAL